MNNATKIHKKAILICNGDYYDEVTDVDGYRVAVDGGMHHWMKMGIIPNLYVGDFDSFDNIETFLCDEIIKLFPEKDNTDTKEAYLHCMKKGITDFVIYGALGGRVNHEYGNIQLLLFLEKKGCTAKIIQKNLEMYVVSNRTVTFKREELGYVSVFSMSDESKVTIKNMKYNINDYTMTNYEPVGINNELIGRDASITVSEGYVVIMYEKLTRGNLR